MHPHRGFETVTYMLEGSMEHRDMSGNQGLLVAGSVQWMTAGRGIVHSEMPKQVNGLMWGFQLWINLPSSHKMMEPRYQDIPPQDIPVVDNGDVLVKVIAGEYGGSVGPVSGIITNPIYLDVSLQPNTEFEYALPKSHVTIAYLFEGECTFSDMENIEAPIVVDFDFNHGQLFRAKTLEGMGRFLLISAEQINEPIARRGPFVMNTQQELQQAFTDYRNGKF
eukprot:TRINITY_DN5388_c0_g1_i3.p1 TRINITY_DN5388_c0_g1~~TRINITY_DN5388_c0_g1_i3.p1  ORF type:complete len:222 (+),score=56.10 TRINITY_DN5388_c0_g1_i3:305-970(+)